MQCGARVGINEISNATVGGDMKLTSVFWWGQVIGLLMLFVCSAVGESLYGNPAQPNAYLTFDGIVAVIIMSICAIAFGS